MKLTDRQQEHLHAFVDGQATEDEARAAHELLNNRETRDEAREYVTELMRLRKLIATHGGVELPEGLRERVGAALSEEAARGNVVRPRFPFSRPALVAVAAAIVLSLAIVYGPPLGAPSGVAEPGESVVATSSGDEPRAPAMGTTRQAVVEKGVGNVSPANTEGDQGTDRGHYGDELGRSAETPARILNLDRGAEVPLELSLCMSRDRDANTLAAYNDVLLLCCLYGRADLKQAHGAPGTAGFAGHDFSAFEGVEVEVAESWVEDLIAAVNRMAGAQGYGRIVVPADLRRDVNERGKLADEIEQLAGRIQKTAGANEAVSEDGVSPLWLLPPETRDVCLRRLARKASADGAGLSEVEARLLAPAAARRKNVTGETGRETSRKIRVLIRLR